MSPADVTGRVFNVQRFCVHDGPGIRTTVFLAGCSLRCIWCHNPEAFSGETACRRSAGDVMTEVLEDRDFYAESGGGLTVSGGEPLLQPAFVRALLALAGTHGIHRCIQTAGGVAPHVLEEMLDVVDLFQFDLKHMDDARHRALTGASNVPILANARLLVDRGAAVEFRIPLVPGLNDDEENLTRVAQLLDNLGTARVRLVPYQRTYLSKYAALGLRAQCAALQPPAPAQIHAASSLLAARGLAVELDA